MGDLYIKILEDLSCFGISQEVNITHVFYNYKNEQPEKEKNQSDNEYISFMFGQPRRYCIVDFLNIMVKNGHLIFKDNTPEPKGNLKWIMPIDFKASITKEGLDYYYNRQLQIASIKNYKYQLWGLITTLILASIAALFSVFNYFKPEPKMVELNKNIQVLSKETKGIKLQIMHLQTQSSYPGDSTRK